MPMTPWASVQSDGTLPLDQHATQFQYKHYIDWEVALLTFGLGMQGGHGQWKIQLIDTEGTVWFEQQVKIDITLVSLGSFGVQLFTWWFSGEEIITTVVGGARTATIVTLHSAASAGQEAINVDPLGQAIPAETVLTFNGLPVTVTATAGAGETTIQTEALGSGLSAGAYAVYSDNPAWGYVLGGSGPASEQGYMEVGGGSDYVDFIAHVMDTWDSPIYLMDVEPGWKLNVLMDSWSLGAKKRVEYQFRFRLGSVRSSDAKYGPFGELDMAYTDAGSPQMKFGHTWGYEKVHRETSILEGAREPSITILPDGRRVYLVLMEDGVWEYTSQDMGMSVQKMAYTSSDGESLYEQIFGPEATMPQMVSVDYARYVLVVRGNELLVRRVTDDGAGSIRKVGTAVSGLSYSMDVKDDGTIVVVDSLGYPVHYSLDNGNVWKEIDN